MEAQQQESEREGEKALRVDKKATKYTERAEKTSNVRTIERKIIGFCELLHGSGQRGGEARG